MGCMVWCEGWPWAMEPDFLLLHDMFDLGQVLNPTILWFISRMEVIFIIPVFWRGCMCNNICKESNNICNIIWNLQSCIQVFDTIIINIVACLRVNVGMVRARSRVRCFQLRKLGSCSEKEGMSQNGQNELDVQAEGNVFILPGSKMCGTHETQGE